MAVIGLSIGIALLVILNVDEGQLTGLGLRPSALPSPTPLTAGYPGLVASDVHMVQVSAKIEEELAQLDVGHLGSRKGTFCM